MKKLIYFFLFVVLVSCGGPNIHGSWQLESVTGEELSESEKNSVITFSEDGTVKMIRRDFEKEGKWKWSDDNKSIILMGENGEHQEEMMNVKIEGDKMMFKSKDNDVVLRRK